MRTISASRGKWELTKDLVCGMEIGAAAEFKASYAGVSYYFCSAECLATFERLAKVLSKDTLESMSPIRMMDL